MATDTKSAPARRTLEDPNAPVIWKDHQENMELRAEERAEKRSVLRACLDAEVAAQYEARKPTHEYDVSCTVIEQERKKKIPKQYRATVTARNEDDAWAHFCTQIGKYPSPHFCDRKIERIKK